MINSMADETGTKGFESIQYNGITYAEVIWSHATVPITRFFSPAESSFQFGVLAHGAGFTEPAHYHKEIKREISDLQQMFVVQRGILVVELYTNSGELFREVELRTGDAIVLVHGIHAIRVVEDMQCVSVKQGPFLGDKNDKINVEVMG